MNAPLLEARNIVKSFPTRNALGFTTGKVDAVRDVSFTIRQGETYGLVGESGSGKSTMGRILQSLIEPSSGDVLYRGKSLSSFTSRELREYKARVQMVFQDPHSSLNPRRRIGTILNEALLIQGVSEKSERRERVRDALEEVGFGEEHEMRYPHEFSGGQRQRIGIARALITNPDVILLDEAVSALDVSIQSAILNLLNKVKRDMDLSYLFISHDLGVVRYISDRIGVMYRGQLVEEAPVEELLSNPIHPYTKKLLVAIPQSKLLSERGAELIEQWKKPASNEYESGPENSCDDHFVAEFDAETVERFAPSERTAS
ncbi:ATP-binding cassette domain-containing protein [Brevibacterium paucivorans]|uniref:ATP-binding cassette domain-containing protein n=1 Tax=Brevibacterium paucivorans TaxID=170994 RepID=UPI00321B6F1E